MSSPYNPYQQGGDQGGQPYQPFPQGSSGYEPSTPQGYLQGGPVGFGEAISQALKNILDFNGRASRSAYWWVFLATVIIAIIVDVIGLTAGAKALIYVIGPIVFLVTLSLQVRRLHDTNRSGFWWFISFVPFVGGIILLIFNCLPGTPGPNRFG